MKPIFLFFSIFSIVTSYAQKDIQELWDLLNKSKPIDMTSPAWKLAGEKALAKDICISGNCENGYGICIGNSRGYGIKHQYEGEFKNGQRKGKGVTTDEGGGKIVTGYDISIKNKDGLSVISRPSGRGFTKNEVIYFQNLSFSGLFQCNCLLPTFDHFAKTLYTKKYTIVNGYGDEVDTKYQNEEGTYKTAGLINTTNSKIFVKAYSKRAISQNTGTVNPIEYYDASYVVMPNKSVNWANFREIPYDNDKKITSNDLAVLTEEEEAKTGYGEYTRFVGQYTENKSIINDCNKNQLNTDKVAKQIGNNIFSVNAYTKTTKIKVKPGDKISLKARGLVILGSNNKSYGPSGLEDDYSNYKIIYDLNLGGLLSRVGDCDWSLVGDNDAWITECSGELQLMINYDHPAENKGGFIVEVKITRAK